MKVIYFSDTDTALIQMHPGDSAETVEINENLYIDLDEKGRVVAITVEHAKESMQLPECDYQELQKTPKSA
ncbi:DUF2283 domain-containing protein [Hydrogenimonas sp.]